LSGVSRWLTPRKALIQQTLRHKRNDHFWFTFHHEAAHLLLHSRKSMFIDGDVGNGKKEEEREADDWSRHFLIPQKAMESFILEGCLSEQDILKFADEQGIAPGIVVGQLQNRGEVKWSSKLNHLKEAIEFPEE
jgi:Zn-dependent peptidase ImmA (M78 family)